jgi:hypothetical protein
MRTYKAMVHDAIRASVAIVANLAIQVIPVLQAIHTTLATLTIRLIRVMQPILMARAIHVIATLQAIKATLMTRSVPLIRAVLPILEIQANQFVRVVRAAGALLAIQAIGTMRAIRTAWANRGVRHTFSGSFAGRIGVLVVLVGAAGAYGMPGRLSAPTLAPLASIDNFNARFAYARADAASEGAAGSTARSLSAGEPLTVESPPSGFVGEQPLVSAEMVFEVPKPASAQMLTELPKTETISEKSKPAPVRLASLPADPLADDYPKFVTIHLPLPKPPPSPAQRLELQGKDYDRAEKCLAQAVYFEARNEAARGQQAVAQVVLNRVFSPYYPKDICSVVYQNAHRHLACQFTFACDGKPERIRERGAWVRANRVAQETLNAAVWLPEVNKATHYHAAYVRPYWIRDMNVMARSGVHIFYRPRNWGDGANEAHWDTPSNTVKSAAPAKPARSRSAHRTQPRRPHVRHYRA